MSKKFLDSAYGVDSPEAAKGFYDDWAGSYDAEIGENGYATPTRLARLLAAHVSDITQPLLDFGCGTGVSGSALKAAGFTTLDGMDISPGMLMQARDKGLYRHLTQLDPDDALPIQPGDYSQIAAIGVVSYGGAPPETLDALMNALASGGRLAFSYNDHTLEDAAYMKRLHAWTEDGAQLIAQEYGDHLPGINVNSMIYVLEKL